MIEEIKESSLEWEKKSNQMYKNYTNLPHKSVSTVLYIKSPGKARITSAFWDGRNVSGLKLDFAGSVSDCVKKTEEFIEGLTKVTENESRKSV